MTKQEVMDVILDCTGKLRHVPTLMELLEMTDVSHRNIIKHFGGYIGALQACNLERNELGGRGHKIALEKLFIGWAGIVRKLKKLPTQSEYEHHSHYTTTPLVRRFGGWRQVPHALKLFAEKFGLAEEWKDELALVKTTGMLPASKPEKWLRAMLKAPTYGPPMWPGPLAYAPANELGVVFLFGWMAPQLGFVVHRLQPEFPDCEAMRRVGEETWQLARIEFEYESRNFLKHMHDTKGCDLIVCWRHNWPECPLEVLELRKLLPKIAEIENQNAPQITQMKR
jgi:Homing endonuclease associated repeat